MNNHSTTCRHANKCCTPWFFSLLCTIIHIRKVLEETHQRAPDTCIQNVITSTFEAFLTRLFWPLVFGSHFPAVCVCVCVYRISVCNVFMLSFHKFLPFTCISWTIFHRLLQQHLENVEALMLKLNVKDEHGCHSDELLLLFFFKSEKAVTTHSWNLKTPIYSQLQLHNSIACKHVDTQKMRL